MAKKRPLTDVSLAKALAVEAQGFIDGVSTVLGILDGSSQLGRHGFVDLDLKLRGGKKPLNGSLQDLFLETVELPEDAD